MEIRGSLLARNAILNLISQVIPLLIGVITIPFVVKGLGTERFGLLSLAWMVVGYFTIFDLGLGRATTKFVAEALGKGEKGRIPYIIWTAAVIQVGFGILGGLILVAITPFLVERVFNIPIELIGEAKLIFYLLALFLPIPLVSGSFSGALEAAQRFDLVNVVKVPSNISIFLLPLVGLLLGFQLPGIVGLILLARFGALFALLTFTINLYPQAKKFLVDFTLFPKLFSFGGWVMLSSVIGPILVYLDRFMVATLLSIGAVAYYTAPYEAVTRLWVIPVSLVMTLFPAFSILEKIGEREKLSMIFTQSIKYLLLIQGFIVIILILFAKELLQLWLGNDFATQSGRVLQILAIGILINSLAHIPYALLHGVGRPDITAKFHLLELPLHIGITWLMVNQWGIIGAATAWTIRVTLDALLLYIAAFKIYQLSPRILATSKLLIILLTLFLFSGSAHILKVLIGTFPFVIQFIFFLTLFGIFVLVIWKNILDTIDRVVLLKMIRLRKG